MLETQFLTYSDLTPSRPAVSKRLYRQRHGLVLLSSDKSCLGLLIAANVLCPRFTRTYRLSTSSAPYRPGCVTFCTSGATHNSRAGKKSYVLISANVGEKKNDSLTITTVR
jgi:hypothetical protein